MSDWFYKSVVAVGRIPFWASSRPVILHPDRVPRTGPFLLASNHLSPYDVPLLMRHTPRLLDFVSIVEVFRNPVIGFLYGALNAFPLDRHRVDVGTTKTVIDRLRRGRVVAIFPEGRLRPESDSVLTGAPFRPGAVRIARLADVPILPVVVCGSARYARPRNWVPGAGVRYGINFGHPFHPPDDPAAAQSHLAAAWPALYHELRPHLPPAT